MKLDSSSADAGTSLAEDSSFVANSSAANTSACGDSSQQKSTASTTSDSAATTATKTTAAANIVTSTESPLTNTKLVDPTTVSSPGTYVVTSPQKKKNDNMEDSVNKGNVSEDKSGNITTSTPVVNKT